MRHLVRRRWIHFMLHIHVWLIQFSHVKRKHQSPLGWIMAVNALGSHDGKVAFGLCLDPASRSLHVNWASVNHYLKEWFFADNHVSPFLINRLYFIWLWDTSYLQWLLLAWTFQAALLEIWCPTPRVLSMANSLFVHKLTLLLFCSLTDKEKISFTLQLVNSSWSVAADDNPFSFVCKTNPFCKV